MPVEIEIDVPIAEEIHEFTPVAERHQITVMITSHRLAAELASRKFAIRLVVALGRAHPLALRSSWIRPVAQGLALMRLQRTTT